MLIDRKSPHGGDIYTNKVRLDFSSNVNPCGMPEAAKRALVRSAENCTAYPDPYCTELRSAISRHEGVDADSVLCGNGAAELIYSFAYSLPKDRPALIVSPTFCEYAAALRAAGVGAEKYTLSEADGFRVTERFLDTDFTRYGAVFLCSPNNPTGITVDAHIIRAVARTGARVLLDCTFLDLTDAPGRYDIPALIRDYPNVAVLRAFTKSFGLAGVRLGYMLCSDAEFLTEMSEKTQCWNVSVPAQQAGVAALTCTGWLKSSVAAVGRERMRMTNELRSMGVRVFPGEANYLLLYSDAELCAELMKYGILTRDCSGYDGLGRGYVRVAVRTREENDILLASISEVVR